MRFYISTVSKFMGYCRYAQQLLIAVFQTLAVHYQHNDDLLPRRGSGRLTFCQAFDNPASPMPYRGSGRREFYLA